MENLQVGQQDIDRLVGEKILIQQTINVCHKSFSGYLGVLLEDDSREVVSQKKVYYKYLRLT